jgi:heme exporter protein A
MDQAAGRLPFFASADGPEWLPHGDRMRLIAEQLTCIRGGRELFRDLGFALAGGEALAVVGRNGAGKSSLLRLIAGLLQPAGGRIVLEGGPADRPLGQAAHFVGHLDGSKAALSVAENLEFLRAILGGGGRPIEAALAAVGLGQIASLPVRMLSAGQKRRLALARLLVAPRPLWLLDEPTTALDSEGQEAFAAIANEHLAGGGLIVAATHAPLKFSRVSELRLGGGAA